MRLLRKTCCSLCALIWSKAVLNAITVDSDTSTSDTLLVFATGRAKIAPMTSLDDERLDGFRAALGDLMLDLAHQIVKDGEGGEANSSPCR